MKRRGGTRLLLNKRTGNTRSFYGPRLHGPDSRPRAHLPPAAIHARDNAPRSAAYRAVDDKRATSARADGRTDGRCLPLVANAARACASDLRSWKREIGLQRRDKTRRAHTLRNENARDSVCGISERRIRNAAAAVSIADDDDSESWPKERGDNAGERIQK